MGVVPGLPVGKVPFFASCQSTGPWSLLVYVQVALVDRHRKPGLRFEKEEF